MLKRIEGTTKGVRITKSLVSHRSLSLTYFDYTEQESHDNTFKCHYKHVELFLLIELLKFPWCLLGN